MKEQQYFCEAIVADLARLFPGYPSGWFTSNAAVVGPGYLLTISMPPNVARALIDAFVKSSP